MSKRSERGDEHGGDTPEERGEDEARRQEQTASELSDRAAEYVDRRYDPTKEVYLDERERNDRDEEGGDAGDG